VRLLHRRKSVARNRVCCSSTKYWWSPWSFGVIFWAAAKAQGYLIGDEDSEAQKRQKEAEQGQKQEDSIKNIQYHGFFAELQEDVSGWKVSGCSSKSCSREQGKVDSLFA